MVDVGKKGVAAFELAWKCEGTIVPIISLFVLLPSLLILKKRPDNDSH